MNPPTRDLVRAADRRLWLVRHGESTWNTRGLVQGQLDEPTLTPLGFAQAEACAHSLCGESVGTLVSSDLRRALETAAIVGRSLGFEPVVDPGLRERSFGVAEGIPSAALDARRSGVDGERVVDADAAPADGETVRTFYRRVTETVTRIAAGADAPGDLVLICHGGVVRVVLAWLDGIGPDAMAWGQVPNGLAIARPFPARTLGTDDLGLTPVGAPRTDLAEP